METFRLVPLDDSVVFPGMTVKLPIDVGEESQIFLLPRHDGSFAKVGVIAQVIERTRLANGQGAAMIAGLHRGVAGGAARPEGGDDNLRVEVDARPDTDPPPARTQELEREYRAVLEEILDLREADNQVRAFVRGITGAGRLADASGYAPDLTAAQKIELLETLDVVARLELALHFQRDRLTELHVRKRIRANVESGAQKQQRDYVLRSQLDSIRKELGEDEDTITDEYRSRIADSDMPDEIRKQAERELGRLARLGDGNPEASMIRSYLDWMLTIPWGVRSEERLDPVGARRMLDEDHAGLDDVKTRITEYLAVRKLRSDRGIEDDHRSGAILTLIGPPGTGKTSIGESIARATGRKFVRFSLGGVRDEAEIRGHRRTYIGALPGRLVRALRDAGTMNPVIMLDEVDKVGADWRGDPSSALLEVLDPAQNHSFRDHYLDVELDLSQVLFITTANVTELIPSPLLDRMEVIRFDGYTTGEKVAIARGYLWPRQTRKNGLRSEEVSISDEVLRGVVGEYTREAGVRQLERELGTVLRKTATKFASHETTAPVEIDLEIVRESLGRQKFFQESPVQTADPGVATGLAVTGTGGEVLFVEAAVMDNSEGLTTTGQLGDVMKESAEIALTWVRSHSAELGIGTDSFCKRAFHVHVPAGAIPKDGPSAGVTMITALASLVTRRRVKSSVGMTGEVTLQGRVLPGRRHQAEGARGTCRWAHRRDPSRAKRARSRRCP